MPGGWKSCCDSVHADSIVDNRFPRSKLILPVTPAPNINENNHTAAIARRVLEFSPGAPAQGP